MSDHDETKFQRMNQARSKYVIALRGALNGAGLREKGPPPVYNQIRQDGIQGMLGNQPADGGYDIESLIRAATALRAALEPFDSSIPRPPEAA